MATTLLSVLGFLAVLGPLVIVHELGHYFFARIFGVKAEAFSVGFGPKLWAKYWGETEVRFSAIPLGGYVKLLGEDSESKVPSELRHRTLQSQEPWKRFFIFFGGPLFNFLFAILVFVAILLIGEPQIGNVIGRVLPGSYAEQIGFRSGDRVVSIANEPVKKFEEIIIKASENPGKPLVFEVRQANKDQTVKINVVPALKDGFTMYGEPTKVGEIDGLFPNPRSTQVGISNPASLAGKLGIRTGDKIISVNKKPMNNWEELEHFYSTLPSGRFSVDVKKAKSSGDNQVLNFNKPRSSGGIGKDLGLYSSELFVEKTIEGSPAEKAGLRSGDRLVSIGNLEVRSFFALRDKVQESGEKENKVQITWERDGKQMQATVNPTATTSRDALLKKTTQFTVGIVPMLTFTEAETFVERTLNPFVLLYKGTEKTVILTWRNLVSIKKMFTGQVSVATLGGPILIGKIAGESIARGLLAFLTTMAFLSVGLGILNVLPVPVLDGGHLLLLGIESIRGKPLTMRQMEIVQQVGLSLILLLMVVVIKNDLTRLPFFN